MKKSLLALILALPCISVSAVYQEMQMAGVANQPQQKKVLYSSRSDSGSTPFKLGAQEADSNFAPSNIGIIGVKYLHRPGETSTIIAVYPNTPAAKAGIQVGDKLLTVDGYSVTNYTADQVYAAIAGRPGQAVDLQLMRCPGGMPYGCQSFSRRLERMDMNQIASDNVFRVYRYGL